MANGARDLYASMEQQIQPLNVTQFAKTRHNGAY